MKIRFTILNEIDVLLVALVLNANVIKFFLNISESSMAFNFLYIICVAFLIFKYGANSLKQQVMTITALLAFPIVAYAFISCIGSSNIASNIVSAMKLAICFFLLILVYSFDSNKIKKTLSISLLVNAIYSIYLISNSSRINTYLRSGSTNYLTMTLTLGMSLTISLITVICILYSKTSFKRLPVYVVISFIYFAGLTMFISRGAILIPAMCIAIMLLLIGFKKKTKLLIVLGISIIVGYYLLQYYLDHISSYGLKRMAHLFTDMVDEGRVKIWKLSLETIVTRYWFILGGGVNSFRETLGFYPHNYYIQILGEYGFFGLIISLYLTIKNIYAFIIFHNRYGSGELDGDIALVYSTFGGMLYLLLTFCKSFTIYEAYPMYIMIAFSLKTSLELSETAFVDDD